MNELFDVSNFDLATLNDEGEARVKYAGTLSNVLSASQLKLLPPSKKGCPRKWMLMYPFHWPKVPNAALIDGVLLHRCIDERWRMSDELWIARWRALGRSPTGREWSWYADLGLAMIRHVPVHERPPQGMSEQTFFLELPHLDTAIYIKPDYLNIKKFRDWKSTAADRQKSEWVLQEQGWWPTPQLGGPAYQSITNDLQSRIYAHGLMQLLDWDKVQAEWVYGSKRKAAGGRVKTWTCGTTFERDETHRWFVRYVEPLIVFANGLRRAWEEKQIDSPLLIPHNPQACDSVGKFCDAFGACRLYKSPIPLDAVHLPVIPQ